MHGENVTDASIQLVRIAVKQVDNIQMQTEDPPCCRCAEDSVLKREEMWKVLDNEDGSQNNEKQLRDHFM